jgi:hypothetical protein
MSFHIDHYDEHNPQLCIKQGDREISFSLAPVEPKSHEWLGGVLDRQIAELVELRVRQALDDHKKKLRELIGAKA